MSESLAEVLRKQHGSTNTLLESFYVNGFKSKDSEGAQEIIAHFNDSQFLDEIGKEIDHYSDGLYSAFKSDFPKLKQDYMKLFIYLYLDFSSRSISALTNQDLDVVYNRKSRLKKLIKSSASQRKSEILKIIN